MGRIDDALRRAENGRRDLDVPRSIGPGPFVSPWGSGEVELKGERSAPAALPALALRHTAAPLFSAPAERFDAEWRERLAVGPGENSILADQFRRLAATLLHVQRTERLRSVMVTSALPEDGKTLTAINLAMVLSASYRRRVLLVEGDFRRPAISRAAGIPVGPGLSEALKAHDDRKAPLIQLSETLTLLPAGRPDSDPLSALTSSRLQALFQDAAENFDWVIVDTPPLGATTDASLLCPLVDAALLVVRVGRTPLSAVRQAIDTLGRDRILGVVMNGSDEAQAARYDYSPTDVTVNEASLRAATTSAGS
jgi:capsular exopolysaccharide synthesis family protein